MKSRLNKSTYGTLYDGARIEAYELRNGAGLIARVMSRGATLLEMRTPDQTGAMADITLGYDALEGWLRNGNPYFGSTVGRYANRIAEGQFNLDGKNFTVPANDGQNSLHGGHKGFDKVLWKAEPLSVSDGVAVRFPTSAQMGTKAILDSSESALLTLLRTQMSCALNTKRILTRPRS